MNPKVEPRNCQFPQSLWDSSSSPVSSKTKVTTVKNMERLNAVSLLWWRGPARSHLAMYSATGTIKTTGYMDCSVTNARNRQHGTLLPGRETAISTKNPIPPVCRHLTKSSDQPVIISRKTEARQKLEKTVVVFPTQLRMMYGLKRYADIT